MGVSALFTQSSQRSFDHVSFFSLKEMRELLCTWVLKVPKQKDWCKEGSDLYLFLYIFGGHLDCYFQFTILRAFHNESSPANNKGCKHFISFSLGLK